MYKELAYLPCAAHNIQLVLKDGLTFDEDYSKLITKVSKDIVSKSKFSTLIAEELRKLDKKLCKRVITRWNSVLFMVRSVLKVTVEEFNLIRVQLQNKAKTKEQKKKANSFYLSLLERSMLSELCELLSLFEFVTDEFQGNGVTISRVYPSIKMLQSNLISNLNSYIYTINLRNKLFESLNSRFSGLIDQDVFVVSTFLDPNFGLSAFPTGEKALVKSIIKRLCEACVESNSLSMSSSSSSVNNCKKKSKYIFHNDNTVVVVENEVDKSMNDYIRLTQESENEIDALLFWKMNESIYPILAKLAKKYLSVQASSAAVERMFSICGHIFSLKRRRLGVKFYSDLVLLKLNEQLI